MMIRWDSLRFRMSVLYSLVLGLILTLVVGLIIFQVRRILYRNFDDKLKIKAVKIANMFNTLYRIESGQGYLRIGSVRVPMGRAASEQTQQVLKGMWKTEAESLNLASDYVSIYDGMGDLINQSENVSADILKDWNKPVARNPVKVTYQNARLGGKDCRWIYYPFAGPGNQMYYLKLASPLANVNHFLRELLALSLATIGIVLLVTSFLGWLLTQRVLRPVYNVVDAARKISHKDLDLRISSEDADEEIRDLINEFNAMIERLQTSFEHINDFSSHVAHELKTPLAIIRGEMELALQQKRDTEEYERVMGVCLEEMDRLIRLIKGLLLLARLDYQPEMFNFQEIDVVPMLQELAEQSQIMAEGKGLKFEAHLPQSPVKIYGDADQLRRLFLNLLDNAVKYTDRGKVTLSVNHLGEELKIEVADTGRGISEEHQKKIFEKFYRVHHHSEQASGTGLGLSISLSIARAHQGRIEVQSQPGQGCAFAVILPIAV